MKRYIKSIELVKEDPVFGMANLVPKRTGLTAEIWSDHSGVKRSKPDVVPRVKIGVNADIVSVSISDNPQVLAPKSWTSKFKKSVVSSIKEAMQYVAKHHDLFLKHYNDANDEFDDEDLFNALRERGDYK